MLMVVVGSVAGSADDGSEPPEPIRFVQPPLRNHHVGTGASGGVAAAARSAGSCHGVHGAVLEAGVAGLEDHFRLYLAQAWSNRAPRGKKTDFKDAQRLVRRHAAGELTLSFVPDAEQRLMRTLTRRRTQLTHERVRIQNQVESLLEETRIKLSSVVTDLFGSQRTAHLDGPGRGGNRSGETGRPGRCPGPVRARGTGRRSDGDGERDPPASCCTSIWRKLALVDGQMEELSRLAADGHATSTARP